MNNLILALLLAGLYYVAANAPQEYHSAKDRRQLYQLIDDEF